MPFRAVHAETGADHVLADEVTGRELDALRAEGGAGRLRCPVCETPMRVRSGAVYAPHFAHVHRRDCPASDDTPELRAARLALYRWLRPRVEARGGAVTVEGWAGGAGLPRPVDLLAQFNDGKPDVAFWLHDRQLGPDKRDALARALAELPAVPSWVFTERVHRPLGGGGVTLSTLERDRRAPSPYDAVGPGEGSLHYLVAGNARLRTYRGLRLVHGPGTFRGEVREDALSDVLVTRRGGLVHPDEPEALAEWEASRADAARAERPVRAVRDRAGWGARGRRRRTADVEVTQGPDEVECSVCGRIRRWVTREGATGRATCGDCVGRSPTI